MVLVGMRGDRSGEVGTGIKNGENEQDKTRLSGLYPCTGDFTDRYAACVSVFSGI